MGLIRFLRGIVDRKEEDRVVLDISGVGVEVFTDAFTMESLQEGEEAVLYTVLVWGEEPKLYGFQDEKKRELFIKLIGVSKLGPKTAMRIISSADFEFIVSAIVSGNSEQLSKVPGIGRKMADRIVTELKDSFKGFEVVEGEGAFLEALEALKALGFSAKEAAEALKKVRRKGRDSAELIKEALNVLMMKR